MPNCFPPNNSNSTPASNIWKHPFLHAIVSTSFTFDLYRSERWKVLSHCINLDFPVYRGRRMSFYVLGHLFFCGSTDRHRLYCPSFCCPPICGNALCLSDMCWNIFSQVFYSQMCFSKTLGQVCSFFCRAWVFL